MRCNANSILCNHSSFVCLIIIYARYSKAWYYDYHIHEVNPTCAGVIVSAMKSIVVLATFARLRSVRGFRQRESHQPTRLKMEFCDSNSNCALIQQHTIFCGPWVVYNLPAKFHGTTTPRHRNVSPSLKQELYGGSMSV
jgi:hypothetical protein